MKNLIFLIFSFILFSCSDKKENINNVLNLKEDIFLNDAYIFGISNHSILNNYKIPLYISNPEYECGSYSNETQNVLFEILHYNGFEFIGSKNDTYSLHKVDFEKLPI